MLGQFFPSDNNINTSTSTNEEVPIEEFPGQSMESVTRIAASLSKFFSQNPRKSAPSSDSLEEKNSSSEVDRSFMMMVHFFRCKSDEMKKLFGDVERYVLPHHIALLDMPFLLCDPKVLRFFFYLYFPVKNDKELILHFIAGPWGSSPT